MPKERNTTPVERNTTKPKKRGGPRQPRITPNSVLIPGWSPKPSNPNEHHPTERTRTLVETMTAYGASQPQIASTLDINPSTLARHYREELTLGHAKSNMAVAQNLFRIATTPKATAPVVNAAVWWTKARMGWSEIRRTSADIRTIPGNMRELTDAQLIEIIESAGTRESEQGALPSPSEPGQSE
jgi:hypothetical protein